MTIRYCVSFRRLAPIALLAAAASLPTGAVAQEMPTNLDATVDVINMFRTLDPTTWDYHNWTWKADHDGLHLEHLIAGDLQFGPRGTDEDPFLAGAFIPKEYYRGELAKSWEVKQDPLRLVFHLREGVYWPDTPGVMERREFVADDVVATFKYMDESPRAIPGYWGFVDRWEAKDAHTAVAYLGEYNANWGYRLAWGYDTAIVPREWHELSDKKRADWKNTVGTGPYKVAAVKANQNVYKAKEQYWDTTTIGGETFDLPLNDKVVYHNIKDELSAIAALRTGQVDIMESIRWQFVDQLRQNVPELEIRSANEPFGTYIALRTDQPPFDDVRVRRAMNLAVNQKQILSSLLNGEGELLNSPFASTWDLYTPLKELSPKAQALFEHKPDAAKQMLADAGYPEGFEFTVTVCTCSSYHMDAVPLLQAYYQNVGVRMNIKSMEYGAFRSQMRAKNQTGGYLINNGVANPMLVLLKSYVTGYPWNPAFYSNPKLDAKYQEAVRQRDEKKRDRMLSELNQFVIEEAVPQVWLPTQKIYRAWWPWVKNYYGELSVGAMRPGPIYARIWIDEKLKTEMGY